MRISHPKLIAASFVFLAAACHGALPFFLNDDGYLYVAEGTNQVINTAHVAASRTAPECQPAERDPAGNWGLPNDGRLFSIRFDKPAYRQGEPIQAHLIVRNVSETNVNYYYFLVPSALFDLRVSDERGKEVIQDGRTTNEFTRRLSKTIIQSPKLMLLTPGTQRKHTVQFDRFYALDPGTYFVTAWVRYQDQGDPYRKAEVQSGHATLRIVKSGTGSNVGASPIANGAKDSNGFPGDVKQPALPETRSSASLSGPGSASSVGSTANIHSTNSGSFLSTDPTPSSAFSAGAPNENPGRTSSGTRNAVLALVLLVGGLLAYFLIRRVRRQV